MTALRPGLTFCRVADRLVFLDLTHDRYFCLGGAKATAFETVLGGADATAKAAARDVLVHAGILVPGVLADPLRPCTAPPVTGSLHAATPRSVPVLTVADAMIRRLCAEVDLVRLGLAPTLTGLARRKRHMCLQAKVDVAEVAGDGFAYTNLIRRRTSRCLSISVATMRWLLARRCAATLVIGVKLHPFAAHCWVQVGGQLINDAVDDIRPFVPILTV